MLARPSPVRGGLAEGDPFIMRGNVPQPTETTATADAAHVDVDQARERNSFSGLLDFAACR
jgi:hypothetical protein